jgi:hypothetical protein
LHKEGSKAGAAAPDVVMQQAPEYDLGLDMGGAKVEGKEPVNAEGSPVQKVFVRVTVPEPEENVINTSVNQQRPYYPTIYEQKRTQYEQQLFDSYQTQLLEKSVFAEEVDPAIAQRGAETPKSGRMSNKSLQSDIQKRVGLMATPEANMVQRGMIFAENNRKNDRENIIAARRGNRL